jgi:hypothetical protein
MGKGKQGQETSRSYVLWLGRDRKVWNNSCLELVARRGGNYLNASFSSMGGEERNGRERERKRKRDMQGCCLATLLLCIELDISFCVGDYYQNMHMMTCWSAMHIAVSLTICQKSANIFLSNLMMYATDMKILVTCKQYICPLMVNRSCVHTTGSLENLLFS